MVLFCLVNEVLDKVVVFVSNPFGFGPTGKTISLIEELNKKWRGKIVYAASPMCQETLPNYLKEKITIESIDERNEKSLMDIFLKYNNPFVVCTLNRLAIKTAKSLGLKAFFIDSLAWMWKEIPEEYLLADTYYCFNLFDIKKNLPNRRNIKVIPPIFGDLPEIRESKEPFILFHIGGFKNPFQEKLSSDYLNLLIDSFSSMVPKSMIIVTGGKDAINFMNDKVHNDSFRFITLGRDEFLKHLSLTTHFVTTSGLTATLEAFALNAPTSFIPPTNLSQWKILRLLIDKKCADSRIEWKRIIGDEVDLGDLTEKEAVPYFARMAEEVYENKTYRDKFIGALNVIMDDKPKYDIQAEMINSVGTNGSEIIIDDLLQNIT